MRLFGEGRHSKVFVLVCPCFILVRNICAIQYPNTLSRNYNYYRQTFATFHSSAVVRLLTTSHFFSPFILEVFQLTVQLFLFFFGLGQ